MFRTVPLSIIRSFSLYTQQWYMSYRFTDIYIALFCKTKYTLCYIKAVFESMERPSGHCNSAGPQDFQSLCKGPPHVVICALNTQHNTTSRQNLCVFYQAALDTRLLLPRRQLNQCSFDAYFSQKDAVRQPRHKKVY